MPIIGTRRAERQRLAGGQADAHPGEQPGPDVDGDQPDLVELDVGLAADELDRRRQGLGVAPAARDLEQGDHALVAADGDADLLGRRLDPEDQHASAGFLDGARTAAASGAAHVGPVGAIGDVAGVDVVVERGRAARRGGRRTSTATTSPHSTSTMPSDSASSASARSATSAMLIEAVEVGVVQGQPAGVVAVHERERRRRDRLGRRRAPARTPGRTPSCRRPSRRPAR